MPFNRFRTADGAWVDTLLGPEMKSTGEVMGLDLTFGVAFAIGWRRAWWEFALTLLAGLGLVAVFWLNVVAYSVTNGATLLG